MAKVMCVGCSPVTVAIFRLEKKFHLVEFSEKEVAERNLESAAPDTWPDVIVLGKLPWRDLGSRKIRAGMINFAERLKHRAPTAKIVLLNGGISHRRSPRSVEAACNSDPRIALSVIHDILSPTG